jgi:hypothetical protein
MDWQEAGAPAEWASTVVTLTPLVQEGITLYFTCPSSPCNGSSAGNVILDGNPLRLGSFDTPLKGNPDHNKMLIWVDRTSGPNEVRIAGGAQTYLGGRIYAYPSQLNLKGQSGATVNWVLSMIASQIQFSGGAQFNLTLSNATEDVSPVERRVTLVDETPLP